MKTLNIKATENSELITNLKNIEGVTTKIDNDYLMIFIDDKYQGSINKYYSFSTSVRSTDNRLKKVLEICEDMSDKIHHSQDDGFESCFGSYFNF